VRDSGHERGWFVMRTIQIRSLLMAAAATLLVTGNAVAQDQRSAILNSVEVRQLLQHAAPADHARLSAHFGALGERYDREARRHSAMGREPIGNPSRNLGIGTRGHCQRLADLNTRSARTARELAVFHEQLGRGIAPNQPRDAEGLNTGSGASTPTEQELSALAAGAETATDHRALEEYFLALAKSYDASAKDHAAFARAYRGTRSSEAAAQHDRMERLSLDAAKEAAAAAEMHKKMAGASR
jgi:hypothetical protein